VSRAVVYLDREWLRPGRHPDCGVAAAPGASDGDSAAAAAAALDGFARRIAAASGRPGATAEVIGAGLVATMTRRLLGADADAAPRAAPAVIADTTGDPEAIADAIRRIDDDGVLVLAGPPPAAPLALDPYPDLHRRSLTVVGVAPPRPDEPGPPAPPAPAEAPGELVASLAEIAPGDEPPAGALWVRVRR
jgi:threonine dehydrogenase-like Zn-dependent dehydrogenase